MLRFNSRILLGPIEQIRVTRERLFQYMRVSSRFVNVPDHKRRGDTRASPCLYRTRKETNQTQEEALHWCEIVLGSCFRVCAK